MGKHTQQYRKYESGKTWMVSLKSLCATIPIYFAMLSAAFYLGAYFMEAKKDREMMQLEHELENRHREDAENKEKEKDVWKEKYFQLLMERMEDKGRSP